MLGAGQWLQFGAATVERTCRQGRVAAESHDGARAHGGGIYAPRGTGVRHLLAAAEGKVTARKGLRGAIYPSLLTACHVEAHRLLQNNPRIISLNGPIDDATSSTIVAQLLFLEAEDPDRAVSPKGAVVAIVGSQLVELGLGQQAGNGSAVQLISMRAVRLYASTDQHVHQLTRRCDHLWPCNI